MSILDLRIGGKTVRASTVSVERANAHQYVSGDVSNVAVGGADSAADSAADTIIIDRLFELMVVDAARKRKEYNKFDGLNYWQKFKQILEKYDRFEVDWIPISPEYVEQYMRLPEKLGDGTIDEINHFAIQHVRIPTTDRATMRKIIQVALNIGQYWGTTGKLLSHNRIDMFVSVENQNRLSAQISYVDIEQLLLLFGFGTDVRENFTSVAFHTSARLS